MKKDSPKNHKDKSIEQTVGQILRQLRQERGLSQEELALESGYHRTYISQLERGQKNPSLRTIFQLAKALEVEPSEIIERVQSLTAPR
jgi:transcriptional regulator with XRE-family HTH domain